MGDGGTEDMGNRYMRRVVKGWEAGWGFVGGGITCGRGGELGEGI